MKKLILILALTAASFAQQVGNGRIYPDANGNVTTNGSISTPHTPAIGGTWGSQPNSPTGTGALGSNTNECGLWADSMAGMWKVQCNGGIAGTLDTTPVGGSIWFVTNEYSGAGGTAKNFFGAGGLLKCAGILLQSSRNAQTTTLEYLLGTADNNGGAQHLYDFALYGPCSSGQASCPRIVRLGPTAGSTLGASASSTTLQHLNWESASASPLQAGRYYMCWGSDVPTSQAALYATPGGGNNGAFPTFGNNSTSGGFVEATSVSASVSAGTATFTGTFTSANWAVNDKFVVNNCTGGSGWNGTTFAIVTASNTAITASAGSAAGSPTGCTLTLGAPATITAPTDNSPFGFISMPEVIIH